MSIIIPNKTKSIKGFGNNEVLKTLTQNFNICDTDAKANANANADAWGSTIALRERCSGQLKMIAAAPHQAKFTEFFQDWSNVTVRVRIIYFGGISSQVPWA